jgi:predicted ATPase/class 3 adenylate cyclase
VSHDCPVGGELPTGTITFLFTDVEGSTTLLQELGTEMYARALADHRATLRDAFASHRGVEVDTQGDAFFCVFSSARDAVACAAEVQGGLAATPIRVRMGLHSGEALVSEGHYVGLDVHQAARIGAAGHGGQVLLSPTTAALLESESFSLRDLGEHRLKDLSAPVRLYQLGHARFPPLKTLHRTNLPVPATPFVGRRLELEAMLGLVRAGSTRLLTLTGPGGTGKTRLALQLAAELAEEFPGGVYWTPLAALREAAIVPSVVGHALGVEEEAGVDIGDSIAAAVALRTLLLIDNCEHLLDGVAQALPPVLRATENLHVLATSREPLSLAGEHIVPVDPLERSDAIELFLARTEAAGAEEADEATVAQLCARLDDLPLAIELAAARTPALPPALLLERLSTRSDLLRGTRDAEDRQRTLEATIGWSYDLLSPDEQRAFRAISIFVGGATLEALEDVAEAEVASVASLVTKSLVRVMTTTGGPRYWMLETIREFAADHLVESELVPLQRRFVDFYARLAADAGPKLEERDAVSWLDRLDADLGNLRTAYLLALEADEAAAPLLGVTLGDLHVIRGRYAEADETLTAVRDRVRDPLVAAKLHDLLAELYVRRDDFVAAAEACATGERLLDASSNRDESWWKAWLDLKLGEARVHYWKADSPALHSATAALRPSIEEHGTPRQRANFIGTQILDLLRRDRYTPSAEAEALAWAYLAAANAAGDWDGHFMLAFVLLWRGKLMEAVEHFRAGRDEAKAAGDVLLEVRCLVYQAVAQRRLGDVERVRSLDAELAELEEPYGYTGLISANRAWLAWRDGDLEATDGWGYAAVADWRFGKRAGPTMFQWCARFPLLAAALSRGGFAEAAEQARVMLDESQQALPEDIRAALVDALVRPSAESFAPALAQARLYGFV